MLSGLRTKLGKLNGIDSRFGLERASGFALQSQWKLRSQGVIAPHQNRSAQALAGCHAIDPGDRVTVRLITLRNRENASSRLRVLW